MRTLLAGNGINIQFGGAAYTSQFIIARMKQRAIIKKYDALFENTISGEELSGLFDGFVDFTKKIIAGECDELDMDYDLKAALDDFKLRYDNVTYPHDIMLEDWLFVLKMYFLLYNAGEDDKAAEIGFKRLFLDAIYNEGEIQSIHHRMGKKVCRFFKGFDEIYTVNYDANLEHATLKPVYHLHGTFTELQASENPEYALGYYRLQNDNSVVIPSFEHCFCNALLSYSGDLKYREATMMHRANIGVKNLPLHQLLSIPQSEVQEVLLLHELHPELKVAPEYYFDRFENITGELCVVGMSPNNDLHIINMIKNNRNITEVAFYCYSDSEKNAVRNIGDDRFKPLNVKDLWASLGVEAPKKYVYKFPPNSDELLNWVNTICTLSDYQATWEKIKQDIASLPQYEIKRLYNETFEELSRHDAIHSSPKDNAAFKRNFSYISHIALKEGLLPPSLLLLFVMNSDKY